VVVELVELVPDPQALTVTASAQAPIAAAIRSRALA
jgi:hypothetical protein